MEGVAAALTVILTIAMFVAIVGIFRPFRLRTHCGSQKMTVAAMQMADMKV